MAKTNLKGSEFSTSVLILTTAVWQHLSRGNSAHTYLLHIGSLQQTEVQIIPESNKVKQWVVLGLLAGIWVTGCLQEQKWLKKSVVFAKFPLGLVTGHKAENLEHDVQPVGSSASWRVSFPSNCLNLFPGSSTGCSFFQTSTLESVNSFQLFFSERLLCSSAFFCLWGILRFYCLLCQEGGIVNLGVLGELSEALLSCLPSCLKSFSVGWNISILEKTVHNTTHINDIL